VSGPPRVAVAGEAAGATVLGLTTRQLGLAMAFGGMLLISTDSLITRAAEVNGWVVTFWYGVFICPTMLLYLLILERGRPVRAVRRSGKWVLVSAVLQTISTTAFIMAVKNTTISNVVIIVASVPLLTALLAWALLGERASRRLWFSIMASVVGVLIVVWGSLDLGGLSGNLLALTAVVAFAFNLTIWRRFPGISRVLVIAISAFMGALLAVTQTDVGGQTARTYLLMLLMGTVFGPTGRIAVSSSTRYITAAEVSLMTPVETVAASLWAWLAFAEQPPPASFVGGAIVLAAVAYGTILPALRRSPAGLRTSPSG